MQLPELVRWYMAQVGEDIPARTHLQRSGEGGTPEWAGAFRAWLTGYPLAVDDEGEVLSPYRFCWFTMWRSGWHGRVQAEFLHRVAWLEGDWLTAARVITPLTRDGEVMAHAFATVALRAFWRRMHATHIVYAR